MQIQDKTLEIDLLAKTDFERWLKKIYMLLLISCFFKFMWLVIIVFNEYNPFQSQVPLLYNKKTSEDLWFSDAFRGYGSGTVD